MTTLLLTNRLKNIEHWIEVNGWRLIAGIILIWTPCFIISKCNHTNHQQDIPDVVYKARAFLPITSDTTKPQKKVIYNHYKLEGSDTLFQLLWLQVLIPDDISPNQNKRLQKWLQSSIKIDSTIRQ